MASFRGGRLFSWKGMLRHDDDASGNLSTETVQTMWNWRILRNLSLRQKGACQTDELSLASRQHSPTFRDKTIETPEPIDRGLQSTSLDCIRDFSVRPQVPRIDIVSDCSTEEKRILRNNRQFWPYTKPQAAIISAANFHNNQQSISMNEEDSTEHVHTCILLGEHKVRLMKWINLE